MAKLNLHLFSRKIYKPIEQDLRKNERMMNVAGGILCSLLLTINIAFLIRVLVNVDPNAGMSGGDAYAYAQRIFLIITMGILALPIAMCLILKFKHPIIKYFITYCLIANAIIIKIGVEFPGYMLFILPLIFCIGYYNSQFTFFAALTTFAGVIGGTLANYGYGMLDLNSIDIVQMYTLGNNLTVVFDLASYEAVKFISSFIPNFVVIVVLAGTSIVLSSRGANMLLLQQQTMTENAQVDKELQIASSIQQSLFPNGNFDNELCKVNCFAKSAKQVGGDFVDYFDIDDTHFGFVIGDVSGKGIPSSLFATTTLAYIRTYAKCSLSPDRVIEETNNELFKVNKEKLFVTVWFAVVNFNNGDMVYVNAGHNPPLISLTGGKFETIEGNPNFVLGRKEHISFTSHHIHLSPNDKLLVYTDGVTEAMNSNNELFGLDRLKDVLTSNKEDVDVIEDVITALRNFTEEYPQSDDITMLSFVFKDTIKEISTSKTFKATKEDYPHAHDFVINFIKSKVADPQLLSGFELTFDEIYANISLYGKGDSKKLINVEIDLGYLNGNVQITYKDDGIEFNPLENADPSVVENAKNHKLGGLGIFLTKKFADKLEYEFVDNKNVLKLTKKVK